MASSGISQPANIPISGDGQAREGSVTVRRRTALGEHGEAGLGRGLGTNHRAIWQKDGGSNYFVLSPQRWIESTQAIGIIRQGLPQPERLLTLNEIAITQMCTLLSANNVKRLK